MREERRTLGKSRTLHFCPGTRLVFSTNTRDPGSSLFLHRYSRHPRSALPHVSRGRRRSRRWPRNRAPRFPSERPEAKKLQDAPDLLHPAVMRSSFSISLKSIASKGGKTMQKRTGGGLVVVFVSFLCPLPSVCQNRGEKSDDPKSLKKMFSND